MPKLRRWDWVKITINNNIMLGQVIGTSRQATEVELWYCDTRVKAGMRTSTVDLIWLASKPQVGSVDRIPKTIALLLKPNEWRDYGSTN